MGLDADIFRALGQMSVVSSGFALTTSERAIAKSANDPCDLAARARETKGVAAEKCDEATLA
eukprot:7799196-Pyramimonas_sp.AAC.1